MWHRSDISGPIVCGKGHTETVEPGNTRTSGNSHRGNSYRHGSTRTKTTMGKLVPKELIMISPKSPDSCLSFTYGIIFLEKSIYQMQSTWAAHALCSSLSFSIGCTSSPKDRFGQYLELILLVGGTAMKVDWISQKSMTMGRLSWVFCRKSIRL